MVNKPFQYILDKDSQWNDVKLLQVDKYAHGSKAME
jgi:hypothetical protein